MEWMGLMHYQAPRTCRCGSRLIRMITASGRVWLECLNCGHRWASEVGLPKPVAASRLHPLWENRQPSASVSARFYARWNGWSSPSPAASIAHFS